MVNLLTVSSKTRPNLGLAEPSAQEILVKRGLHRRGADGLMPSNTFYCGYMARRLGGDPPLTFHAKEA